MRGWEYITLNPAPRLRRLRQRQQAQQRPVFQPAESALAEALQELGFLHENLERVYREADDGRRAGSGNPE